MPQQTPPSTAAPDPLPARADHAPHTPQYRPAFHYSPRAQWMNDPNGLLLHRGVFHVFYQYHPASPVWGPMHWGHASSRDLLHWQEHPIALAPDTLGMIFSGSAVHDSRNSAGLAPVGQSALVAIFTHHQMQAQDAGSERYQSQSLAYSLDDGQSWHKYAGNPVLANPGLKDFRDPKVFWHERSGRWIMCLACGDHIAFYASPNLKDWTLQSRFGQGQGAHGGVWECPDLFELADPDGARRWVLLASLTPGGPQGGSATQYFVGDFDGRQFVCEHSDTRWLDWGPDNYAGVSFSHTPGRCLFLGWMSNWRYATQVPTAPWRSAMTLPRELRLQRVDGRAHVCSAAAGEVDQAFEALPAPTGGDPSGCTDLSAWLAHLPGAGSGAGLRLTLAGDAAHAWRLSLSNDHGEVWHMAYEAHTGQFVIDRRQARQPSFHPDFAARHSAARISRDPLCRAVLYLDACSVELMADGGLSTLTSLVFPSQPWTRMQLECLPLALSGARLRL